MHGLTNKGWTSPIAPTTRGRRRRLVWTIGVMLLAGGCDSGTDTSNLRVAVQMPRSLKGTEVDGALHTDAQGDFVFDEDAQRLFDYFLAAQGEVDDAVLGMLVRKAIDEHLQGAAAEAAWGAFEDYLDYREEAGTLVATAAGENIGEVSEQLQHVRAQTIGADAPLPDEVQQLHHALALKEILEDKLLDADGRQEQVQQLLVEADEASDPQAPSRMLINLRAAAATLGPEPTPDALYDLRASVAGNAAAERLAALDDRRADWTKRLKQYQAERDALQSHAEVSTDPDGYEQELTELRARHFDSREQLRVAALERNKKL